MWPGVVSQQEELAEPVAVDAKINRATAELKATVLAQEARLRDIHGGGAVVAAGILADVAEVARFADRNRFVSWTAAPRCFLRRTEPTQVAQVV